MDELLCVGWREWCSLPELGLPAVKVKVDSGAKTSALHAFRLEPFSLKNAAYIRFWVHPLQRNQTLVCECTAPIKDQREVSDSGGHKELRYVIETPIQIGRKSWKIDMTLTNRDSMRFRMLLGRTAMDGAVRIDPAASYLNGKLHARKLYDLESLK